MYNVILINNAESIFCSLNLLVFEEVVKAHAECWQLFHSWDLLYWKMSLFYR